MSMNPTAILKIFGALSPLMGNKEIGEAFVAEVKTIFQSIHDNHATNKAIANALVNIDGHLRNMHDKLGSIEEKLQGLRLPLSDNETRLLLEHQINGRDIRSNG